MLRYLVGIALLVVAFGPLFVGVRRLRRALLSSWDGSAAWLAEALLVATTIVGVTEVLGLLGIYRLFAVVLSFAGLGIGFGFAATRLGDHFTPEFAAAAPSRLGRSGNLLAAAGLGIVAGPWTARASYGFTAGIPGADTLWYHLPAAARLVQTGSLRSIDHFDADNLTAYYPNASTFFHAIGMVFLESDMLSPLVNHGWVALALLAGWVLGRPFGVSAATFLATAVTVSFPGFVGHEAGSAMNDVTALALVLAALALLVNARPDGLTTHLPVIALAGAATGIALATKWTVVPTTGALTLGVVVLAERGHRLRTAATWLAASGAAGLLSYVRNLVLVGNPFPPLQIEIGPLALDRVGPKQPPFGTIVEWIGDAGARDSIFRPGLELWFGPLWWAAPTAAALGLVLGLAFGGSRLNRLTAFVGLVALASYLLSPQNLVFLGVPAYFLSNLRYGILALGLGLVLFPLLPWMQVGRRVWIAPAGFVVLLIASATSRGLWRGIDDWRFQDPIGTGDTRVAVLVGLGVSIAAVVAVLLSDAATPTVRVGVAVALGCVALFVAIVAKPSYDEQRFAEAPFWNPAVNLTDARIALYGVNTQLIFYGPDLSNHVQWVGRIDDQGFTRIETCAEWVAAMNEGNYSHAVVLSVAPDDPGPYRWTLDNPSATLVTDGEGAGAAAFFDPDNPIPIAFFRLDGPLDPAACGR